MREKTVFKKIIDFEEAKELIEQMRRDRGFPSGYRDLDKLCGGLVKDGVTLIAARPGMGDISFAMNIVSRLSQQQEGTILIWSPDMDSDEITIRLLSIGTDMSAESLLNCKLPPDTIGAKFADYYSSRKGNIEVTTSFWCSLDDLWDCCFAISDLRLVVISPIEAICQSVDFSTMKINPITREEVLRLLQKIAQTLEIPVLCTTHLHRSLERRKNKRPHLGDLKKIGLSADMVDQIIFLYRDRYYDPEGQEGAELIVAKVAQGDVGTIRLDWDYATGRFTERKKE